MYAWIPSHKWSSSNYDPCVNYASSYRYLNPLLAPQYCKTIGSLYSGSLCSCGWICSPGSSFFFRSIITHLSGDDVETTEEDVEATGDDVETTDDDVEETDDDVEETDDVETILEELDIEFNDEELGREFTEELEIEFSVEELEYIVELGVDIVVLILVLEDDVVVAKVEEELSIFAVKVGKLDEVVEVNIFAELEDIGESEELKLIWLELEDVDIIDEVELGAKDEVELVGKELDELAERVEDTLNELELGFEGLSTITSTQLQNLSDFVSIDHWT